MKILKIKFYMLLFILIHCFSYAGPLPEHPILKIEAGMHTGTIWRIASSTFGDTVVTASHDKTLRVWNGKTGKLKNIIRIPSGLFHDGRIYAAAMTSDARYLVASGWTNDNSGKKTIFIFDLLNNSIKKRIKGLPNVTFDMAVSNDNRYLAVSMAGKHGMRIYSMTTFELLKKHNDYKEGAYWVTFGPDGKVYTSCYDGYIRKYSSSFNFLKKTKVRGGKKPFAIDVSPDNRLIALGFSDTSKVEIFDVRTFKHKYLVNDKNLPSGALNAVCWSWDGQKLFAGGKLWKNNNRPIVVWKNKGKGVPEYLPGSKMTIMDINPIYAGGLFWSSSDPAFGRLDSNGTIVFKKSSELADFREMAEKFKISDSGDKVQYGYKVWGKELSVFSLRDFTIFPGKGPSFYRSPKITGLNVTGWDDGYYPKINDKKLKLENHERSRTLAISDDNSFFVLGTEWNLYKFSPSGKQLWKINAPAVTWNANITSDGSKIVAAFSDGTIRWFRSSDGKLLLSFFPHGDKKRWVCWSSSGYYAASPGGDNLIGWHMNRGRSENPDFYSAGQFRKKYARPYILTKIIDYNDEQRAIKVADREEGVKKGIAKIDKNQMLPPVVRIVSPGDGYTFSSNNIEVEIHVRNPSGLEITDIKYMIDGRPASIKRGLKRKTNSSYFSEKITLPSKDCKLSVVAEHSLAASVPAAVNLKWIGKSIPDWSKPSLYVLSVGVSDYEINDLDLNYAAKDARDFAAVWEKLEGRLYRNVKSKILTDSNADRNSVLDAFDWIEQETTTKDIAVIFLAGHGVTDRDGDYYYLPGDGNPDKLRRSGVSYGMIRDLASGIAGKVLFFLDTCHSGRVYEGRRAPGGELNNVINDLSAAENGAVVFTASTGRQYALENPSWNNGAFTKAIVEGLLGGASYGKDNRITISMLEVYVSERVKILTGGKQTPATAKPAAVPDFPIALKLKF